MRVIQSGAARTHRIQFNAMVQRTLKHSVQVAEELNGRCRLAQRQTNTLALSQFGEAPAVAALAPRYFSSRRRSQSCS